MRLELIPIAQPISGEFEEKIYDFDSPWKSSDWSWIKFEAEKSVWCGEFRGRFRGAVFSKKFGVIVVLTSDAMYVLNEETREVIELDKAPTFINLTVTPLGDILVNDGYSLSVFRGREMSSLEELSLPIEVESLEFLEYKGDSLRMRGEEMYGGGQKYTLFLDFHNFKVSREEETP